MHTQHITLYYDLRTQVYTDASKVLCAHVAHIADYMLEQWWTLFAEAHAAEVTQTVAFV